MSYRNKERARIGAKVDLKSKFEKFEKLSKTDQNDNPVKIGGKDRFQSYQTKREVTETKRDITTKKDVTETKKEVIETKSKDLKATERTKDMDKTTRGVDNLKLRDTGSSLRSSPSSTRGKTGTSDFAARKAEERKKNEDATKKMKSIEQRMQERKQQKIAEQKKKVQGRAAFKQRLEANAPKDAGDKNAISRAETNIDKLLKWVQNRINVYPGIKVEDWSSSWADGKAFCALVQSLEPETFPVDDVDHSGQNRKNNFQLAFDFACEMGVPKLLDADDMASISTPDRRSVITYVHTIYKIMVHEKREKEKEENKDKKSEESSSEEEK